MEAEVGLAMIGQVDADIAAPQPYETESGETSFPDYVTPPGAESCFECFNVSP
jgi:hypothetical protein